MIIFCVNSFFFVTLVSEQEEGGDERGTEPRTAETLVDRLKRIGRNGGPRTTGQALRLLEDGRRDGIKDVRAYNAVFRVSTFIVCRCYEFLFLHPICCLRRASPDPAPS